MRKNLTKPREREKKYTAICWYEEVVNTRMPVTADSEEEAKETAEEKFKAWNDHWMKAYGGNEKKLLKIDVEER